MKKAILYCRISSDDQSNFSIEHQESTLRAYCVRMNINVVDVIIDQYSAKTFDRPNYQKVVSQIKAKKNYCNAFMFLRWDRFSRNIYNAMHELKFMQKHGVEIICHDQPVDLSSPDGKMMLAIYLMSPEIENDKISIRTIEGMRKGKLSGNYCGKAPVGYLNARNELGKPVLLIDPVKGKIVKHLFEMFAYQNASTTDLYKYAREINLVRSGNDQIPRILRNVVYAGKISVPATVKEAIQIVPGNHEPIVSEQLFNLVQDIICGRKRAQKSHSNEDFPLRGVIACGNCGNLLTASFSKGRAGKYYAYYHCQGKCKFRLSAPLAHERMQKIMYEMQLSPAFSEAYHLVLKDVFNIENKNIPEQISKLETMLINQDELLSSADDKFLNNQINSEDYNRMKSKIYQKKSELERNLSDLKEYALTFESQLKFSMGALKNLGEEYFLSNAFTKKNIVGSIFPEKLILEKNNYRTTRLNSLIIGNTSKFGTKKEAAQCTTSQNLMVTHLGSPNAVNFELFKADLNLFYNAFRRVS